MVDFTKVVKIAKMADAAEAARAARAAKAADEAGKGASQVTQTAQSKPLESQFQQTAYHYTQSNKPFEKFDPLLSRGNATFDRVGVHVGTKHAAYERYLDVGFEKVEKPTVEEFGAIAKDSLFKGNFTRPRGFTMQLKFKNDKPLLNPEGQPWTELALDNYLSKINIKDFGENAAQEFQNFLKRNDDFNKAQEDFIKMSRRYVDAKEKLQNLENSIDPTRIPSPAEKAELKKLRQSVIQINTRIAEAEDKKEELRWMMLDVFKGKKLADQGYTHIPYVNAQEDAGNLSFIVLDPEKNLRSSAAAFKAERGGIMSGAAGAAVVGGTATQEEEAQ